MTKAMLLENAGIEGFRIAADLVPSVHLAPVLSILSWQTWVNSLPVYKTGKGDKE